MRTHLKTRVLSALVVLLLVVAGCDRVTSPEPSVPDQSGSVFTLVFERPLPLSDGMSVPQRSGFTVTQLEHVMPVGDQEVTEFIGVPSGASPDAIRTMWMSARRDLFDALGASITRTTRSGATGKFSYSSADVRRAGSDGDFRVSRMTVVGPANRIPELTRAMPAQVEAAPSQPAFQRVPDSPRFASVAATTWVPQRGGVETASASKTERYIYQQFIFDNVSGYAGNRTLEMDFILNNNGNSELGPGTYLTTAEYLAPPELFRVPKVSYAASNLPIPYLDTRDGDSRSEPAYTIGSAYASALVARTWYFTYIRAANGTASRDNAKLMAQLGTRRPEWCQSTWCVFGIADPVRLSGTYKGTFWEVPIPSSYQWTRK